MSNRSNLRYHDRGEPVGPEWGKGGGFYKRAFAATKLLRT